MRSSILSALYMASLTLLLIAGARAKMRSSGAAGEQVVHWHVNADGKLLSSRDGIHWNEPYSSVENPAPRFRVVETKGDDVWAAGSHGTVIHSRDQGLSWEKRNIPADEGDIVRILIAVDGSILVKTSKNHIWISRDDGMNWLRR